MTMATTPLNQIRTNGPSRHDNPFATCWTRPGALPFHFPHGIDADQLIAKLAGQSWRGAIIGPHGSGKSTLLETLKPALAAAGRSAIQITLRDGQRHLPRAALCLNICGRGLQIPITLCKCKRYCHGLRNRRRRRLPQFLFLGKAPRIALAASPRVTANCLLIVDGYEQLSRIGRLRAAWHCHRTGCGLLVTSHAPVRIATLIELTPTRSLIEALVGELCQGVSTRLTADQIAASHARHGSNVREIFFDLYDRHERLRRWA
jgi:hypothetical protein